jgi:Asp/Glu/hydantoin racemase
MVLQIAPTTRILVFNPNTNVEITNRFEPVISTLRWPNTAITYWTCPTGPSIIKNQTDMYESASHCIPLLLKIADDFDGFLGACYADHPIVRLLQSYVGNKPVVGIFDASIMAALQLVGPDTKFSIVTTGLPFEALLSNAVKQLLGHSDQVSCFGGVFASGVGLNDLHPDSRHAAREKMMAATTQLVRTANNIDVIIMGGVILAGMEGWVHEACELELGVEKGRQLKVVDQFLAGMLILDSLLRQKPVQSVDFRLALR